MKPIMKVLLFTMLSIKIKQSETARGTTFSKFKWWHHIMRKHIFYFHIGVSRAISGGFNLSLEKNKNEKTGKKESYSVRHSGLE